MTKGEKAQEYFLAGKNCSQSVAMAFSDETGLEPELISRLTIGFGGGVGRLREVCGTVSGMTFVLSAIYGDMPKAEIYKMVQTVADKFKEENGSVVCRELLGLTPRDEISPVPEKRTNEYYKKRPCVQLVAQAADILDKYLKTIS